MKEIQYMVLVLSMILLSLLVNEKYDQMMERMSRKVAQGKLEKKRTSELYVAKAPWGEWINHTPEGREIHIALYSAIREGKLMWIVRRDGEYLNDEFEYTTDREISFESGLAFIARQDTARRKGEKILVE